MSKAPQASDKMLPAPLLVLTSVLSSVLDNTHRLWLRVVSAQEFRETSLRIGVLRSHFQFSITSALSPALLQEEHKQHPRRW